MISATVTNRRRAAVEAAQRDANMRRELEARRRFAAQLCEQLRQPGSDDVDRDYADFIEDQAGLGVGVDEAPTCCHECKHKFLRRLFVMP